MKLFSRWMLRILFFLCFVPLLFSGCARQTKAPPDAFEGAFRFNAGILYDGKSYSAQVQKDADGVWTMEFTDPPGLQGFKVRYENGRATVTYLGLNWEVPENLLPDSGATQGMLNSLEDLKSRTDMEMTEEEDHLVFSGKSASGKYLIYVEKETQQPVYAKLPDLGLEFSIEDFSVSE